MNSKVKKTGTNTFFKKSLKWTGIFLVLLITVSYSIFKSSYVQTLICSKIGDHLSKKTQTTIRIGEVDFRPFDIFILKDLLVLDHKTDTMLFSGDFSIVLNNYNFKKNEFNLDKAELNETFIRIKTYKGEKQSNFKKFINKLKKNNRSGKNRIPKISVDKIEFDNLRCVIWDENIPKKNNAFDYNHLDFTNLKLEASDFKLKENKIELNAGLLAFNERSGFKCIGMSGEFLMDKKKATLRNLKFKTNETNINGEIQLNYEGLNSFKKFFSEVVLKTHFKKTKISSNDLAYFSSSLKGLNQSISLEGNICGTINDLSATNLKFSYGKNTYFDGEIKFDGLGDGKKPVIEAKITNLITFENDLKEIPILPFEEGKKLKTPKWMKKVGKMEFRGDFKGPTSNFEAMGVLKTNAGSIKADVQFKSDSTGETKIIGNIITNNFDLGKTIDNSNFGQISMNGKLNALARFDNNRLIFSGKIPKIDFKGYSYSDIRMDGTLTDKIFKGALAVKDDNLVFDFDGSIDFSVPQLQKYDFKAELKKANLRSINWVQRDSSTQVSGKLKVNMMGNQFEDLNGYLNLDNIVWKENGKSYKVDSFNLNSVKKNDREMMIIKSDLMHAKIEGIYNLSDIYPTILNVLSKEIPSIIKLKNLKKPKGVNNFSFMAKLNDYSLIHELFTPKINLSEKAKFSGKFDNNEKSLSINFAADSVLINDKNFYKVKLYSSNSGDKLNLKISSKYIEVINKIGVEDVRINSTIKNNKSTYNISYSNNSTRPSFGEISGNVDMSNLDSIKVNVVNSKFIHNDSIWQLENSFSACIANKFIAIRNFNFHSKDQFLKINGTSSAFNSDRMIFELENFHLNSLNYFWSTINLELKGQVTGNLKLDGGFKDQVFFTDISVSNLNLNNQKFGKLKLNTFYKKSNRIINVNVSVANKKNKKNNLLITGEYYPFEKGKIKLNANLKNTELKFLERYFDGVFSEFKGGKTSGNLAINGTIKHPLFNGVLNIDHLKFGVDYLNVTYAADAQKLVFKNDLIWFNNFTLSHDLHPKSRAKINGFVNLNGFQNITYSMDSVFLNEFYCLNTTLEDNSTFYGQVYVDGLVQFRGNGKTNYIGGSVSTTKSIKFDVFKDKYIAVSSSLELPLDESEELEISEFASFVNLSKKDLASPKSDEDFNISGIDLDFNFKINPESNVRILFDPAVGDEINTKGNGSISMLINSDGKFKMFGDFSVTQGNYFFTLQNIIGKKFIVEPGSKISWNGDPMEAQMNMKTYYKSRANLINLIDTTREGSGIINTSQLNNRIQVNSNLGLFGSLWKPELKIGISLPGGTPEQISFLQEKVSGADEINRQAFSLILTSQFLPLSKSVGSIVSDKAGLHNGMQFVEGQINNALSGLLHPNLDLGVDYNEIGDNQSNNNVSKDELRLLAGFKYKNISLKTDFDINNQVGDIEAEFKITEALKAKAYHKTTTDATALINNQTNTVYGLGAAYQKSFNNIKDLFRKKEREK